MVRFGRKGVSVLGALVMGASGVGFLSAATVSAHADPAYSFGASNAAQVLAGAGSDTIQDVVNGFAGADNNKPYPPLLDVNNFQIASFDAVEPGTGVNGAPPVLGCIVTKPGGALFDRPNGSGNGLQMLSDALGTHNWPNSTDATTNAPAGGVQGSAGQPAACNQNAGAAGGVPIPGTAIDFARSSSGAGSSAGGDQLRFVPFARDGVSVICYDATTHANSAGDACHPTTAELNTGYTSATGTFTDGAGDTVGVCIMQPGSGTAKFWGGLPGMGSAAGNQTAAAASGCNAGGFIIEEHNANEFFTRVTGLITGGSAIKAWVMPMSAAQWIAQGNGTAFDRSNQLRAVGLAASPAGGMAPIDGVTPVNGAFPAATPNPAFYAGTGTVDNYGRDVYIVVSTPALTGTNKTGGVAAIQNMFGSTPTSPLNAEPGGVAVICQAAAQNEVKSFGFDTTLAAGHTCGVGIASSYF
jgi:hypothetical protein